MKKIIGVLAVLLVLTTGAAAKNFTIQDSGSNPLFKVDGNTGEKQLKNGLVNISEGGEPIAKFEQSGITFDQPLSLESPGALSVANGVDLTGSSGNTIESYSTFYLTTSSGSPSDIVLQPSGEVGVDANLSTTGDLDLQNNSFRGAGGIVDENGNKCNANQFLNGNGVCETDTDTDTTLTENEAEQFIFDTGDNDQGNLGLNGNEIVDTQGSVTLGGGNVNVPDGNLGMNDNSIYNLHYLGGSGDMLLNFNQASIDTDGASDITVWDTANSQEIANFNEGGNVEVPNGKISVTKGGPGLGTRAAVDVSSNDFGVRARSNDNGRSAFYGVNTDSGTEAILAGGSSYSYPVARFDTGAGNIALGIDNNGNVDVNQGDISTSTGGIVDISTTSATQNKPLRVKSGGNYVAANFETANRGVGTIGWDGAWSLTDGNLQVPDGGITVSGNTDGVDLDNPGNAITINSNQYEVASGSIADNEIQDNTIDNSEIQNGDNFDFGNVDVSSPSNTGSQLDVGGGANFNGNVNLNNGGGLQNVNSLEMDGDIYGAGVDMSIQEVGSVLGPNNGDTDLNIQTQGGGNHEVSIEDGSSSNADIAVFEEGSQNVRIPNGRLGINTADPQKDLDVNGDARIRGNLDVWGNITNTQVNNLNVNGSLVPPDGYDATFDVGSSSNRWRDGYFSGTVYASNIQDTDSGNSIEDTYVDEAGDTMTGALNMGHNDINDVDQLTIPDSGDAGGKNLLQVGDDAYMTDIDNSNTLGIYGVQNNGVATIQLGQSGARISGDSNGNLNAGSSRIVNAADPTNAQDVATKSYVDNSDNTGTDDQTLGEVLNQGNTANQNIDMNGNSVTNAQSVSFNSDEEITGSGDLCLGDRCA